MKQMIPAPAYTMFIVAMLLVFGLPLSACSQSDNDKQATPPAHSTAQQPMAASATRQDFAASDEAVTTATELAANEVAANETDESPDPVQAAGVEPAKAPAAKTQAKVKMRSVAKNKAGVKAEKAKPAAPKVDVETLTERLKNTDAIGVFTKIAIRNDIVDLVDEINRYRKQSKLKENMNKIRSSFDGLLLKIVALLEGDPNLSRDLYVGRESIWKSLLEVKA